MSFYKRLLVFFFSVFLLSSCGYSVKESLVPVSPPSSVQSLPKVIILPFADYTSSSPYETWQKNVLVLEALQDEFLKAGFATVPYEEVVQYLMRQGVIKETPSYSTGTNLLYQELGNNWSPEMRKEIWKAIEQNRSLSHSSPRTVPLDNKVLKSMAHVFGARYVVRGRIIAFNQEQDLGLNPFQNGLIPFVFHLGSRTIFGVADSDAYELINQAATGALLGAGAWHLAADDELVGAFLGAGSGTVFSHTGKVAKARVQLRLFIQDAFTGELVWSNRAEIEVAPKSIFAANDREKLFTKAVNQAAKVLIADFASDLATGNLPPVTSEMVSPAVEEAKRAAEEAQRAALKAQKAAQEANAAALKTERIFEKSLTK